LVVWAGEAVPPEYQAANGTIALRVPDSELVRALARRVGALAVTSANLHGEPSPASAAELAWEVVDGADLTLDAGPAPVGVASTIVGCAGDCPQDFREGALSTSQIMQVALGE
jgi:L-threonylcarbamoyladenylate synthase